MNFSAFDPMVFEILLSVGIVISIVCTLVCTVVAFRKGRNVVGWVFGGIFLSLIGVIILVCLPSIDKGYIDKDQANRTRLCIKALEDGDTIK
ncbi:MAG: hypothetical protein E7369_04295 [Clostridiales bacterium]|nr:hypothetical protein [Clostridiales bacterium]